MVGSVYTGYPDGSFLGYRNAINTTLLLSNASAGVYQTWSTNMFGEPTVLLSTDSHP